ncbi:MAG: hypothetical protein Q9163_003043 [Psora crenata]
MLPSQLRSTHLLLAYCFLSTFFSFRFIYLAKQSSLASHRDVFDGVGGNAALTPPGFPQRIWQTSKTGPADMEDGDRKAIQSWTKLNQKHRYEIITHHSGESYVRDKFRHRPVIQVVFQDLQDPMLRADVIQYLILLEDGGIYTDIDTKCLRSIEDWVPSIYNREANFVLGIEYDSFGNGRWLDWTLDLQLATWTILAKPGHWALEIAVEQAIRCLRRLARQQETTISEIKTGYREVLDTTGPAMFTEAVFRRLVFRNGFELYLAQYQWTYLTTVDLRRLNLTY